VACLALAVAACSGLRPAPPAAPLPAVRPAGALAVDPAGTEVRVLVYRAGALASLGHNHVITASALAGRIDALPGGEYQFDLVLPVAAFVVDPAGARAEEGPDFAAPVADDARAGTRGNLLGERVLDAGVFPDIRLAGQTRSGPAGTRLLQLAVTLRGTTREFVVPVTLEAGGGGGVLRGELPLAHADLGLTPFSVMGGMIAVRDDLLVRFRVAVVPSAG
jgi:hypothetical protein